MRATTILFVSAALAVGCSKSKPDEEPVEQVEPGEEEGATKADPEQARVEWSAPIKTRTTGGTVLGVPLLDVEVGSTPTQVVLDTSSHHHTLTRSFADSVPVPVLSTKKVLRVTGKLKEAVEVDGPVEMVIAGAPVKLEQAIAAKSEPETDALGVGGMLAPGDLVDFAHILVADFRGGKIYHVKGGESHVRSWFSKQFGEPTEVPIIRDEDGLMYIDTSIDPERDATVKAVLDTGSAYSRFEHGQLEVEPQKDECVEGLDPFVQCVPGRVIPDRSVQFGGKWYTGKIVSVPLAPGDPKVQAVGSVGMDILRNCTIAFTTHTEGIWTVCDG